MGLGRIHLMAQNPQHRDVLCLAIRRFRALALTPAEQDFALAQELQLVYDAPDCDEKVVYFEPNRGSEHEDRESIGSNESTTAQQNDEMERLTDQGKAHQAAIACSASD